LVLNYHAGALANTAIKLSEVNVEAAVNVGPDVAMKALGVYGAYLRQMNTQINAARKDFRELRAEMLVSCRCDGVACWLGKDFRELQAEMLEVIEAAKTHITIEAFDGLAMEEEPAQ